jgi:ribonuclease HI
MAELKEVTVFTDGACCPNPGAGGYGVVLLHGRHRKHLSGGYRCTTSNRMELQAAIVGLQALKYPCKVTLFSDSQYLVDGVMQGFAQRGRANGWMKNRRERVANFDLWEKVLDAAARHQVRFEWVRGHAGNSENERCDRLAEAARRADDLPADEGYENAGSLVLTGSLFDIDTVAESPASMTDLRCSNCRAPIPRERLEAIPDATLCVACQRETEAKPVGFRLSDVTCPRCAGKGIRSRLVWRTPRDPTLPPYFLGCTRFPECRYIDQS